MQSQGASELGTFTKPGSDFVGEPYLQEHLEAAARMVATDAAEDFQDEIGQRLLSNWGEHNNSLAFDSPLEAAFWVWWMAVKKHEPFAEGMRLEAHVSVPVGEQSYVVDFVILPTNSRLRKADKVAAHWPLIGIELDGHAFHEKTLEQVSYRNQRDRALQQAGWHIFHFSFSEFSNAPSACIFEVLDWVREQELLIYKRLHEVSRGSG